MTTVKIWGITLDNVSVAPTNIRKTIIQSKLVTGFVNVADLGKSGEDLRLGCTFDDAASFTDTVKELQDIINEPNTTLNWVEFDKDGTKEVKSGWYAIQGITDTPRAGTEDFLDFEILLTKYGNYNKIWGEWTDWTVSGPAAKTDESSNQKAYEDESGEIDAAAEYIMVDGGTSLISRNGHYKAFCRIRSDVITDEDDYVTFELIDNTASQDQSDTFYTAENTSNLNTKINKYWTEIFLDCPNLLSASDMDLKVTLTLGDTTDFFIDYFGMYCYCYTHGA